MNFLPKSDSWNFFHSSLVLFAILSGRSCIPVAILLGKDCRYPNRPPSSSIFCLNAAGALPKRVLSIKSLNLSMIIDRTLWFAFSLNFKNDPLEEALGASYRLVEELYTILPSGSSIAASLSEAPAEASAISGVIISGAILLGTS